MKMAKNSRLASIVLWVVLAIQHWNFFKIERTHAFKAGNVHAILLWVGAALMMCVNPANRTKVMLRGFGVELIERELVFTLGEVNVGKVG